MVDWFVEYSEVVFREFGPVVKRWITLNEPRETAVSGYGGGWAAPGVEGLGTTTYVAAHNQILAHAAACRLYRQKFQASQGGECGITLNMNWAEPRDPTSSVDQAAAERGSDFMIGWFAQPIFGDGAYPASMRQKVDEKSLLQGFNQSRLPHFTDEESALVLGSADFLGLNIYTAYLMYEKDQGTSEVSYLLDSDTAAEYPDSWVPSASDWLKIAPFGIRRCLQWVSAKVGSEVPLYITENGFSDYLGNLDDLGRIYYLKHYLNQVLKAILEDGIDIRGYYAWSLLDNMEWGTGYTIKFGLNSVNFTDPERKRWQNKHFR